MKKIVINLICIFFTINIFAQLEAHLINNEGWIKGKYVEIGINSKGVFGASKFSKPSSFHENREFENFLFGFIANPQKDNWVDYDGDFFTPGTPEEGFSIEINGANYSNNSDTTFGTVEGSVISSQKIESDCFESLAQIQWQGNVDGLGIKRTFSVTEEGLFIQMITSITNLSGETKKNVFFMHNVDPDNNVSLTGNYSTKMEIISQPNSTSNISLVKATQESVGDPNDLDGSAVSFYANDENARVTFGGFNNRIASDVWNGVFGLLENTVGSSSTSDIAMSIAFKLGDILPSETKTFVYYYILEEVDETFIPLIVNISTANPTRCNLDDGIITLSGLEAGESYNVSYTENSVMIPSSTYVADSLGNIVFDNLEEGTYSNFLIEFDSCVTELNNNYTLISPTPLVPTINETPPTNCDGNNGTIIISGLTPGEETKINYKMDGVSVSEITENADSDGSITIENLSNGTYSNFTFFYVSNSCDSSLSTNIVLNGTFPFTAQEIQEQFYCDEDFDFVTNIDFFPIDEIVLGTLSPTLFSVTYHASIDDANNSINLDKNNYTTTGQSSYSIFAKVQNNITNCFVVEEFTITINIPENFSISNKFICQLNDDNYVLPEIGTNLDPSIFNFEWYYEGSLLSNTTPTIFAEESGTFSLIVTTISTSCSYKKEIEVLSSGEPNNIEIILESELFDNNQVVSVIATGLGNYLYKLNDGDYQEDPTFQNVPIGFNTFYVFDINGCGVSEISQTVIGYPKFFTPNGDTKNELWHIVGLQQLTNPEIHIFNRYGKVMTILTDQTDGWNGIYKGKISHNTDYWFLLLYTDEKGIRRKYKSHFSLLRP